MTPTSPPKLLARNVSARRRAAGTPRTVVGNPVSTRLESGVGNCFPGLEFDLRNLERRFFPFLEVELAGNEIRIIAVDVDGATAAGLPRATLTDYRAMRAASPAAPWTIIAIAGNFGPLGMLSFDLDDLDGTSAGASRRPVDAWTAVRLLVEDSEVTIRARRGRNQVTLTAPRTRYLAEDSSINEVFSPGELTRSLCSPWTHDFRDCGCFYWASNHPDIVQPTRSADDDPAFDVWTSWQRADRDVAPPAPETIAGPAVRELSYFEINERWKDLPIIVAGRENLGVHRVASRKAKPFGSDAELVAELRYAAGVELAVLHEYLAAAYSIADASPGDSAALRDDKRAAFAEIIRIAIAEMRHLRAVNDVLAGLAPLIAAARPFRPALAIASKIPVGGAMRDLALRPATHAVLDDFIRIEGPSVGVDGLYSRILATLDRTPGADHLEQAIRSIMADGEEHWETFRFIRQWLGRHAESDYLRPSFNAPSATSHDALNRHYADVLRGLHRGYSAGLVAGGPAINTARNGMTTGATSLDALARAVANAGFRVAFATPNDPDFDPIAPP